MNERLSGEAELDDGGKPKTITFRSDPAVLEQVPDKRLGVVKELRLRIYMAGNLLQDDDQDFLFLLTSVSGNPTLIVMTKPDAEVDVAIMAPVMLAAAKAKKDDLLFVGWGPDWSKRGLMAMERNEPVRVDKTSRN